MRSSKYFLVLLAIIVGLLSVIQGSCSKQKVIGSDSGDITGGADIEELPVLEELGDTLIQVDEIYDLEEEMPEDEKVEPEELEDSIDPESPDSFIVEDVSFEETESAAYDLGFRVQVFASGELEKAEKIKEKVMSESGLDAYIEYEGGLYKVRVGNFKSREAAAEARSFLAGSYPDCWIVSTTIRK